MPPKPAGWRATTLIALTRRGCGTQVARNCHFDGSSRKMRNASKAKISAGIPPNPQTKIKSSKPLIVPLNANEHPPVISASNMQTKPKKAFTALLPLHF